MKAAYRPLLAEKSHSSAKEVAQTGDSGCLEGFDSLVLT